MTTALAPTDQDELLRVVRRTLETFLESGQRLHAETTSAALLARQGAFVTLHVGSALRGCIGTFEADKPLVDTVIEMAIAAAARDPRFPPVDATELPQLSIEVSVLSPRRVARASDIEVGVHGICVAQAGRRGVLLPQVATEYGWDRETFLSQTCRKAGLPLDAWKEPETRIETFTSQVFAESAQTVDPQPQTCDTPDTWQTTHKTSLD